MEEKFELMGEGLQQEIRDNARAVISEISNVQKRMKEEFEILGEDL